MKVLQSLAGQCPSGPTAWHHSSYGSGVPEHDVVRVCVPKPWGDKGHVLRSVCAPPSLPWSPG